LKKIKLNKKLKVFIVKTPKERKIENPRGSIFQIELRNTHTHTKERKKNKTKENERNRTRITSVSVCG
jgi:hypothetical protein